MTTHFTYKGWSFESFQPPTILPMDERDKWDDALKLEAGDKLPDALFGDAYMKFQRSNGTTLSWNSFDIILGTLYLKDPKESTALPWMSKSGVIHAPFNHAHGTSNVAGRFALKVPSVGWKEQWQQEHARKEKEIGLKLCHLDPQNDWSLSSNYMLTAQHNENLSTEQISNKYEDREIEKINLDGFSTSDSSVLHFDYTTQRMLPMGLLADQSSPILFHNHTVFFTDDLDDCGQVNAEGFLRVMERFWFAKLQQLIVVDNVHVRLIECRIFHQFDVPTELILEWTVREVDLAKEGTRYKTSIDGAVMAGLDRQSAILRFVSNARVDVQYNLIAKLPEAISGH